MIYRRSLILAVSQFNVYILIEAIFKGNNRIPTESILFPFFDMVELLISNFFTLKYCYFAL